MSPGAFETDIARRFDRMWCILWLKYNIKNTKYDIFFEFSDLDDISYVSPLYLSETNRQNIGEIDRYHEENQNTVVYHQRIDATRQRVEIGES